MIPRQDLRATKPRPSKCGSMCINFVRCGPSCGVEFNVVTESQRAAERERWGFTEFEQGGC